MPQLDKPADKRNGRFPAIQKRLERRVRHWLKQGFARVPAGAKGHLCRSLVYVDHNPPAELVFKLAETRDELEQAFELLHDSYVKEGFSRPHPSGLRVTLYHALPTTSTLVAKVRDRVVGTVSLIRRSQFPLPLESAFDISSLSRDGAEIVEISSLAIHPEFRGHKASLLLLLCKYLYSYCMKYFAIDYMVIAFNPRQRDFYEHIFLFDRLQEKRVDSYGFANGAPALGAVMDLRQAYNKLMSVYWSKPASKNLFTFFMQSRDFPNFVFPDRAYFKSLDPVLTPELLNHFFNERTELFHDLAPEKAAVLRAVYGHSQAYLDVLPEARPVGAEEQAPHLRRGDPRFSMHCKGTLAHSDLVTEITVNDVSAGGFRARLRAPLEIGARVTVRIQIGKHEIACLVAECIRRSTQGTQAGFRILAGDGSWQKLIAHLKADVAPA